MAARAAGGGGGGGAAAWDSVRPAGGEGAGAREEYSSWHDIFREQLSGDNPDPELQAILDGTESNAELEAKIKARFEESQGEHLRPRGGADVEMDVKFLEPFDPFDLWIEFECAEPLNDEHRNCFDQMFKAWYILGNLGGFNATNAQTEAVSDSLATLAYDRDHAAASLDAHFHDLKDPQVCRAAQQAAPWSRPSTCAHALAVARALARVR